MTRLRFSPAVSLDLALSSLALSHLALLGLAFLSLAGPAAAGPVLQFKFAHDAVTPGAPRPDPLAQPIPHRVPEGLPGFYDLKTNTFVPLVLEPAPAAATFSGFVSVTAHLDYGPEIRRNDTVFCILTVSFGNVAGKPPQFFSNHTVSPKGQNFGGGKPVVSFQVPYEYKPNSAKPYVQLTVACRIPSASDGTAHANTVTHAEALQDGNVIDNGFQLNL